MRDMHVGNGPSRPENTPGGVLVQVLRCHETPAMICLPLYTNIKNYAALSAAFFPGEVITLWVDCMALCSGRPFLPFTLGPMNHYSDRQ